MQGVNKCIFLGTLGQDPEIKYSPEGGAVARFSIAINDTWTSKKTGNQEKHTEWVRCVAFGRLAEISGEYLRKGSKVYVEGRLYTNKWQDRDGNDRYSTEIRIQNLQFLDSKPKQQSMEPPKDYAEPAQTPAQADFDDDIPF